MNTATVYISLGGNMGNEAELFERAVARIGLWPGVRPHKVSGLYLTQPQEDSAQPWFRNQVAAFMCDASLRPQRFLDSLLSLECKLGRVRDPARRFGPRTIDLDLLLFGDIVCTEERLRLPHPRMAQRAFVLVPLAEIAADLIFPDGTPIAICLKQLKYTVDGRTIFQSKGGKG